VSQPQRAWLHGCQNLRQIQIVSNDRAGIPKASESSFRSSLARFCFFLTPDPPDFSARGRWDFLTPRLPPLSLALLLRWLRSVSTMAPPLRALAGAVGLLATCAATRASSSSFRPTALFGDHMVLQAGTADDPPAQIGGQSGPGEAVTLSMVDSGGKKVGQTLRTAADAQGRWTIGVRGAMNQGPLELTLSSMGATRLARDVYFGSVLLCTGQSNSARPTPPTALPARPTPPTALPACPTSVGTHQRLPQWS
jgi:hypothetical protein